MCPLRPDVLLLGLDLVVYVLFTVARQNLEDVELVTFTSSASCSLDSDSHIPSIVSSSSQRTLLLGKRRFVSRALGTTGLRATTASCNGLRGCLPRARARQPATCRLARGECAPVVEPDTVCRTHALRFTRLTSSSSCTPSSVRVLPSSCSARRAPAPISPSSPA